MSTCTHWQMGEVDLDSLASRMSHDLVFRMIAGCISLTHCEGE